MRLLFPIAIAAMAATPNASAKAPPLQKPGTECASAASHFAREGSMWTRDPARPQKLAELPPAEGYAAVYRLDERGCMVPVKFREVRR
ncbi:MAG TPA: hypothetical protein VI168_07880 [Croceibacterium sp.]